VDFNRLIKPYNKARLNNQEKGSNISPDIFQKVFGVSLVMFRRGEGGGGRTGREKSWRCSASEFGVVATRPQAPNHIPAAWISGSCRGGEGADDVIMAG